jgi:uncharacterized protein (DUF1786 family)
MKIKKINHLIKLDNMVLLEFETVEPLKVNNEVTTNLFRFDYDHESRDHNVMVALQDSHYVSDNANHLFNFDLLENQIDELLNTQEVPDLTEEYKEEMDDEVENGWE